MNKTPLLLALMLLLIASTAAAQEISLFYKADVSATLDKTTFAPGETITGTIGIVNREQFPIPEVYVAAYLVRGDAFFYPSQKKDTDNIFVEHIIDDLHLSPTHRIAVPLTLTLPEDLAPGNYRLDFYGKPGKGLITGIPYIFAGPVTKQITVTGGNGGFPQAKIVRSQTLFHLFPGPIGPGIEASIPITNEVFVENTGNTELKNLKVYAGLCEWDDTSCETFISEDTQTIPSIAAGEIGSAELNLTSANQPDAYAVRIEVRDSAGRLHSLYRNRSIVFGGTAKIHKLYVNDFLFDRGEEGAVTMYVGPTPDHYLNPAFEDFELRVRIKDVHSDQIVYEERIPVTSIGEKNSPEDYRDYSFPFTAPNTLDLFEVCGYVEKGGDIHEEYCFIVDASKFITLSEFSPITAEWKHDSRNNSLDVTFVLDQPELSDQVNASFALIDFGSNDRIGNGFLTQELPHTITFENVQTGRYTLVVNNFLTKRQTTQEIIVGNAPSNVSVPASCQELNGIACQENEACTGSRIAAGDIPLCCSTACTPIVREAVPEPQTPFALDGSIVFYGVILIVIIILLKLIRKRKGKENDYAGFDDV